MQETDVIRFIVGTQSLKFENQVSSILMCHILNCIVILCSLKNLQVLIYSKLHENDLSSDAIVKQRISAVTPGDQVQTYIDVAKQVHLITNTRRELDTQKRLRPRTRPLSLGTKAIRS